MSIADELDICPACDGSGSGVADTICYRCSGTGGVPRHDPPAEVAALVEQAGHFPRSVTHDEARDAAENFIDAHFNNRDGRGVLTGIPARADHDDLVLSDYIKQRRVAEQALDRQLTIAKAEAEAARAQLAEAKLQLEYLDERFPTGTTPAVIAKIDAFLTSTGGGSDAE